MSATPSGVPLTVEEQMEIGAKAAYGTHPVLSFGPYILGMWMDAILLGVLFGLFIEWKRYVYPSEKRLTRLLVFYLLLVSFVISCYVMSSTMYLFVAGFGVYRRFLNPSCKESFAQDAAPLTTAGYRVAWILNTFSRVPAAAFFTHRAYLISNKSIFIPLTVVPLLLTSAGCAFGAYITSKSIPIELDSLERVFVVVFVSCELMADVINTTCIALGLYRSRTGWRNTDRLIVRLFIILAETQLPPTLAALGFLICFVGFPNNRAIFLFAGIGKVHVLCLYLVCISRVRMRMVAEDSQSYPMKAAPQVTVETYVHSQEGHDDDKYIPHHAQIDSTGTMRTVNGRPLPQNRRDSYGELESNTSLVVTLDG